MVNVISKLGLEDEEIEVSEGSLVSDLKKRLPEKWQVNVLIILNGKIAREEQVLNKSDRVTILPLIAGG